MLGHQVTAYVHQQLRPYIRRDDVVIDATMGNGYDTSFLLSCIGSEGQVVAFDIQPVALLATEQRLRKKLGHQIDTPLIKHDWQLGNSIEGETYRLIYDSHQQMATYVTKEVGCVMFNFGYLPSADKSITTEATVSLEALKQAIDLLRPKGIISLVYYTGHPGGDLERKKLMAYLQTLDWRCYDVVINRYCNHPQEPPQVCFVYRKK